MTTPRKKPPQSANVDALMGALDHPMKEGVEHLRGVIRAIDPRIVEEVKWNAPSYKLDDHFATFNLRSPASIQLVLHTGAKVKARATPITLSDPEGLLSWPSSDRAVLTLKSVHDAKTQSLAVTALLEQWIRQL